MNVVEEAVRKYDEDFQRGGSAAATRPLLKVIAAVLDDPMADATEWTQARTIFSVLENLVTELKFYDVVGWEHAPE